MVSLKGMVIRSSSIIPEIREAIFRCLVCGFCSEPVPVERGNFMYSLVILVYLKICNVLPTTVIFRANNRTHYMFEGRVPIQKLHDTCSQPMQVCTPPLYLYNNKKKLVN